ncbi:MAG: polynucleotide adenylyltransferase PcnB, partial [Kangiellaceae bacterium]|nr:polynucleotide adenylyltransferase PcnB [Kangiellaceae bacterium]
KKERNSSNETPIQRGKRNNHHDIAASDDLKILTRGQHCVSRKKISKNALKVLYKLNEAGYQAYLVGGGVRDILLGLQPKDFDVATNATPEEIQSEFRNCRLIGRRFRLAHILFGREVIEVATFRAGHEQGNVSSAVNDQRPLDSRPKKHKGKDDRARKSDHGMLVRDNVYGSIIEDAFRRDFTVNALYYTVSDFSVIDYTQGLEDLAARKLRLIGDPDERYREDPVRILRAIRLSCKLGLTIEKHSAQPIEELASLLSHVSSARLWDESNKLLLAGHAEKTWNSLCEHKVAQYLFPQTIESLQNCTTNIASQAAHDFIRSALANTDKRIANNQPVTPAFLFAVFLWQPLQDRVAYFQTKGMPAYEAHQKAASIVMDKQRETIGIPKRFSAIAKEMWALQFRLTNRRRKGVQSLISHVRFRAAYDFLCLRAGEDEELKELAKWWTDYQDADAKDQDLLLKNVTHPDRKKRRPDKNSQKNKPKRNK